MSNARTSIPGSILKRLLAPHHLYRVISLQRNRKEANKVCDDPELKLYHNILPGDFLHYGYFENEGINPIDISLNMIYHAQEKYGQNIVDFIDDYDSAILDVGCGMGGLLGLMNQKKYKAIGLTPDKNQAKHIKDMYPNEVLEMKFEDLQPEKYKHTFGTIITSESLQYLNLDIALPLIATIIKPGGKWIACDYFRTGDAHEKSGHNWDRFINMLNQNGFKLQFQKDITQNVLPTISYIHMWATQILMPLKEFGINKLKIKSPGFHYALCETISTIEGKIEKNIKTVCPVEFAKNKKYMLMVIVKK